MEPDVGSESRFLPAPPAFDAPVREGASEYCRAVWYRKTSFLKYQTAWQYSDGDATNGFGYLMVKKN